MSNKRQIIATDGWSTCSVKGDITEVWDMQESPPVCCAVIRRRLRSQNPWDLVECYEVEVPKGVEDKYFSAGKIPREVVDDHPVILLGGFRGGEVGFTILKVVKRGAMLGGTADLMQVLRLDDLLFVEGWPMRITSCDF